MHSKKKAFVIIAVIFIVVMVGLSAMKSRHSTVPSEPPKTVSQVDLERYMGTWYEISSIPALFSVGCTKTQATYTLNPNGIVNVHNQCERFGFLSQADGTAIAKDSTNAKLSVSLRPGRAGSYWIVRLADDYSNVVVSNEKYSYLWVLSRTPQMDNSIYESIIEDLRKDGYSVDDLSMTEQ